MSEKKQGVKPGAKKELRVKEAISKGSSLSKRRFFNNRITVSLPDLVEIQKDSYAWFWEKGLRELFEEINPIPDFTGKDLEVSVTDYYLDEPKYPASLCKEKNISYEAPLRAKAVLVFKKTGEVKEQEIYLGEFPLMTERGTFIINGVERVVVSQLIRSPGVFFTMNYAKGKKLFGAKIIPNRGAWLEIETDPDGVLSVKIDRKRKLPITTLLKAFGFSEDEIRERFKDIDTGETKYIENSLLKDGIETQGEAYREVYKRLRPGDLATEENAKQMIDGMFFNFERYDFGAVGRYRLNQRLDVDRAETPENRILNTDDLVLIISEVIRLNNDPEGRADDIDHLGNRRVRAVGELIQNKLRVGMYRMVRNIKDRMSTCDPETVVPGALINPRPVAASVKEFFSSSQLSQYMDQVNPLAELEHKRRLSAMGPGGLTRERAGFEVRDVHHSHYGRICPIETPEGPNIGLVGHLASYARVNEYGFLETPYLIVKQSVEATEEALTNRVLAEDVKGVAKAGQKLDGATAKSVAKAMKGENVPVKPFVTLEIEYLNAIVEDRKIIAHAGVEIDEHHNVVEEMVEARVKGHPETIEASRLDYMDVSFKQCISIATALIPFLENDDANRALMGSNMQRQAVSCVVPESPIVGTGIEDKAARDSGQVVLSQTAGEVIAVDGGHIVVRSKAPAGSKKEYVDYEYPLQTFEKSNNFTSMNQVPRVSKGQKVEQGELLADGASTDNGELALGQNMVVAFVPWDGFNYEDAIIISERVVQKDRWSSIHI